MVNACFRAARPLSFRLKMRWGVFILFSVSQLIGLPNRAVAKPAASQQSKPCCCCGAGVICRCGCQPQLKTEKGEKEESQISGFDACSCGSEAPASVPASTTDRSFRTIVQTHGFECTVSCLITIDDVRSGLLGTRSEHEDRSFDSRLRTVMLLI